MDELNIPDQMSFQKQISEPLPDHPPAPLLARAISEPVYRSRSIKYSLPLTRQLKRSPNDILSNQLLDMGFDEDQVEISLNYVNVDCIEDAIGFLTSDQDFYHIFKSSPDEKEKCIRCGLKEKSHRLILKIQDNFTSPFNERKTMLQPSNTTLSLIDDEKQAHCCLCLEQIKSSFFSPLCEHYCCHSCSDAYIKLSIINGKVPIVCPIASCFRELDDEEVSPLLSPEEFNKYKLFQDNYNYNNNPNVRWCQTPNCGTILFGSEDKPHLICEKCKMELCFNCNESWERCKNLQTCSK